MFAFRKSLELELLEDRVLLDRDALGGVTDVRPVLNSKLVGDDTINRTLTNWQVRGADLGHMFDLNGKLYMVFGDTFAGVPPANGGAGGDDWRSNTMAVISHWQDPEQGLPFDSMISDTPGHAQALIQGNHDPNDGSGEVTKIPTYGIASHVGPSGHRMYLHFMSVKEWLQAGAWNLNYSALAYSDDFGQHWTVSNVRWAGDSNFGQAAIVRVGDENDPCHCFLYFFGIPGGRFGDVRLARVPETEVLDQSAYRYYAGTVHGHPQWSVNEAAAVPVVGGPVGELSVMWDPYLGRWLMTYLNEVTNTIQIRDASQLWAGWSNPHTLVDGANYPGLYGAYMHPWLTKNNGRDIYFTMSQWGPYSVYLMHATLLPSTVRNIHSQLPLNGSGPADTVVVDDSQATFQDKVPISNSKANDIQLGMTQMDQFFGSGMGLDYCWIMATALSRPRKATPPAPWPSPPWRWGTSTAMAISIWL